MSKSDFVNLLSEKIILINKKMQKPITIFTKSD